MLYLLSKENKILFPYSSSYRDLKNISIESDEKITLKTGSNLELNSGADLQMEASGNFKSKATGNFDAEGAMVNVKGNPINLN